MPTFKAVALATGITLQELLEKLDRDQEVQLIPPTISVQAVRINVLGRIVAGMPLDAVEEVLDWEEIPASMASGGEFFGLIVKGDSMTPEIKDSDVVIVKKQADIEDKDIAIVLVNGFEATCKQVIIRPDGLMLQAFNPTVYPTHFTNDFRKYAHELNMSEFSPHKLRHMHATILLENNIPLKVIQERLGNSSITETADIYSHVTNKQLTF